MCKEYVLRFALLGRIGDHMEPVEPLHRTSVMLPVSLHKEASEVAKREHMPLSFLIRRSLRRELDRLARAQARRSA